MFINYYIKTFYILKQIILYKFNQITNDKYSEFDNKEISNYIYATIFFYIAIFYFMKYHSFSITIQILKHIKDLYKQTDFKEISIIEKTLLLRTNYNLGLFLYIDGCSQEAIKVLLDAKIILSDIKLLSLSKENKRSKYGSIFMEERFNENSSLSQMFFNIKNTSDDEGDYNGKQNKSKKDLKSDRRKLFRQSRDFAYEQEMNNLENKYENFYEKIYNDIELLLAEIESSKNCHKETFNHINKLLFNNNKKRPEYFRLSQGKIHDFKIEKEENNCNYKLLNGCDRRKIMFLLNKINDKYYYGIDSTDRIYQKQEQNISSKKYFNSKEMEKFFLFICSLSEYQLKILNETQPKESRLRNSLPIIFTNEFTNCLTNSQRMNLNLIESMKLSRYLILKNINDDIYPNNLDFLFMKSTIKDIKGKKNNKNLNNKKETIKINKTTHQRNNNKLINVGMTQTQYGGKIFQEKDKVVFNKMLDDITNEKNQEFINIFRESIINVLMNLDNEEKTLFMNSKTLLKDLVKKMKKGMIIHKK